MHAIRSFTKSCVVLLLGREARFRRILRGPASGHQIYVSPTEHLGYLLGIDEPRLQKAIKNYVVPGDTVYDIGANIGYITLSLAKRVGRHGHVLAFEPIPQTFDLLRRNIEINEVCNVSDECCRFR
jgi:protein-L-isoaspartate O-methyltransferase